VNGGDSNTPNIVIPGLTDKGKSSGSQNKPLIMEMSGSDKYQPNHEVRYLKEGAPAPAIKGAASVKDNLGHFDQVQFIF